MWVSSHSPEPYTVNWQLKISHRCEHECLSRSLCVSPVTDLPRMYLISHPVSAGITSSTPVTLEDKVGTANGWIIFFLLHFKLATYVRKYIYYFFKQNICIVPLSWSRLKNDMHTPFFTTGILYHVYACRCCLYPHFPVVSEVVSCPHIWTILGTSCHSICSAPHPTDSETNLKIHRYYCKLTM